MQTLQSFAQALFELTTHPRTGVLLALLVAGAVTDLRSYRIPNALTVPGMVLGLAISAADSPSALGGLLDGFGGLAVALVCLLPLHALRLMGAGDVKLMAMAGAFLGLPDVLMAIVFVLITGGICALGFAIVHRATRLALSNLVFLVRGMAVSAFTRTRGSTHGMVSAGRLPYGVCICIGTAAFLVVRQLGA